MQKNGTQRAKRLHSWSIFHLGILKHSLFALGSKNQRSLILLSITLLLVNLNLEILKTALKIP
jgi:hypothetical protein